MKKLIGVIVVVLFAATLGFGQAKVVATEWQVPFLNCLTGPIAAIGEFLEWGAEYAAKEINASGGISRRAREGGPG